MYHVTSRGDRREMLFLDVDRQGFTKTLTGACQRTGWRVHACCLMADRYHVVLETPQPNLVAGMAWLQGTYTIRRSWGSPRGRAGKRRFASKT